MTQRRSPRASHAPRAAIRNGRSSPYAKARSSSPMKRSRTASSISLPRPPRTSRRNSPDSHSTSPNRASHHSPRNVATLRPVPMSIKQRLVSFFADPNLAYLIMTLGGLCIWVELTHPGLVVPGLLGSICIIVSLISFQMLPIHYGALALILGGMGLLIAELYLPTFGVVGFAGIVCFILGSLFLMDTNVPEFQISLGLIFPTAAVVTGFAFALGLLVMRSRRAKHRPVSKPSSASTVRSASRFRKARQGLPPWRTLERRHHIRRVIPRGDVAVVREVRDMLLVVAVHHRHASTRHPRTATPATHFGPPRKAALETRSLYDSQPFYPGVFRGPLLSFLRAPRLQEYERGVIFRLGRVIGVKGPGVIYLIPGIDRMAKVPLRIVTTDVPPQDVVTRDNVSIQVNAVILFRVVDPMKSIINVESYIESTFQYAQTTLRSVLGSAELDEVLSQRDILNKRIQDILDLHTEPWGVKVTAVEIKQVDLPKEMQRAMATQAEAERQRRAKVIAAAGEAQAAEKLTEAAAIMEKFPAALQLRYLQTLVEVASENNSTTIFPIPIDLFRPFFEKLLPKKES